jgi:hypothetical protein
LLGKERCPSSEPLARGSRTRVAPSSTHEFADRKLLAPISNPQKHTTPLFIDFRPRHPIQCSNQNAELGAGGSMVGYARSLCEFRKTTPLSCRFSLRCFYSRIGPTDCGAAPTCWFARLVPWDFNDDDMYLPYGGSAARSCGGIRARGGIRG